MSREAMLQECDHAICDLLPDLRRSVQKALAFFVTGVVSSGHARLSQAGPSGPGAAQDGSKERRLRRLVANARVDVARAHRRIIARVLGGRRGRLDLLLDATTTGATAQQAGTTTLVFALAWRGRALPLVWRTWRADAPGQHWAVAIAQMVHIIAELLPPDTSVVVLADRGLTGAPFAHTIRAAGWHYCLRVQRQTRVQQPNGTLSLIGALAPTPGTTCCVSGARVYAPRHTTGRHWVSDWDAALVTNVVAVWRQGDTDPWLLVTDLPAAVARCAEYRRRTWEEELFRDLKSAGWNWDKSRVRAPERVDRLLLVLALATLWMCALGQRVVRSGRRMLVDDRAHRSYSLFTLGLRYLRRLFATDQPVPCVLHFLADGRSS